MKKYFEKLCEKFALGILIEDVIQLTGGITNKIYKVSTTKGIYAIKIINKNNIENNPKLLDNIELSEDISNYLSLNNINAISAIKFNKKYVQEYEDDKLLIYNWCSGKVLKTLELNLDHMKIIASIMAKFHKIKPIHNIKMTKYKKNNYKKYYDLLKDKNEKWAESFIDNFDEFSNIYEKVYSCYEKLSDQKAYVHKDLNRKNILWNDLIPYIIDFETATIGNPSIDFFNSAWFLTDDVNEEKFYVFAKEYLNNNTLIDDINISAHAAIIEECNWLEFSLKRALKIHSTDEYEINLGKESVESSLKEIINYYNKIPLMIEIIKKILS